MDWAKKINAHQYKVINTNKEQLLTKIAHISLKATQTALVEGESCILLHLQSFPCESKYVSTKLPKSCTHLGCIHFCYPDCPSYLFYLNCIESTTRANRQPENLGLAVQNVHKNLTIYLEYVSVK